MQGKMQTHLFVPFVLWVAVRRVLWFRTFQAPLLTPPLERVLSTLMYFGRWWWEMVWGSDPVNHLQSKKSKAGGGNSCAFRAWEESLCPGDETPGRNAVSPFWGWEDFMSSWGRYQVWKEEKLLDHSDLWGRKGAFPSFQEPSEYCPVDVLHTPENS